MPQHKSKTIVTGTPVRSGLVRETQVEAKQIFGFNADSKVLLVMGGSLGAVKINKILQLILPDLLPHMGIIHITGKNNIHAIEKELLPSIKKMPNGHNYKPFGYLNDRMGSALVAADVVMSRAGATALAELARLHKAAILLPLPGSAQNHQKHNAQAYEAAEAVRVIVDENMSKEILKQNVFDLIENDKHRQTLTSNIANLDHPNAARDIAGLAFKLAIGLVPRQPENNQENVAMITKERFLTKMIWSKLPRRKKSDTKIR